MTIDSVKKIIEGCDTDKIINLIELKSKMFPSVEKNTVMSRKTGLDLDVFAIIL